MSEQTKPGLTDAGLLWEIDRAYSYGSIPARAATRIRELLAAAAGPPREPTREMVDRFLLWRLPDHFRPDCYVSFDRDRAKANNGWPVGTNLLTAEQATAMLTHVLAAPPAASAEPGWVTQRAAALALVPEQPAASAAPKAEPISPFPCIVKGCGNYSLMPASEFCSLHAAEQEESQRIATIHPPAPDDGRSDAEMIAEAHRNGWADFDGRKACKLADRCAELLAENARLGLEKSALWTGSCLRDNAIERAEAARDTAVGLLREVPRNNATGADLVVRIDAFLATQPAKTGSGK